MAEFKVRDKETGEVFTVREKDTPATPQSQQQEPVKGLFGNVPADKYAQGERNLAGNIFERPAAAVRSAIQGKGYEAGAVNPTGVPKFQDLAIQAAQQSTNPVVNAIVGMPASAAGLIADTLTNPAEMLTNIVGGTELVKTGEAVAQTVNAVGNKVAQATKKIMSYDSDLQLAVKAKQGLDFVRGTLGKAVDLAIDEVKAVPTQLNLATKSERVVAAIKNPIYEVAFDQSGAPFQNVGNLNKMKEAVGDLIHSQKVWEEAPGKEQELIKQAYGNINEAMKVAAKKAGKPIDEHLDAYNTFMDKYHAMNKSIVDSGGQAISNRMKTAFQLGTEQQVKQAWKAIAAVNPEVKSVANSMSKRILLKNLLKAGGAAGGIELGKKVITGRF